MDASTHSPGPWKACEGDRNSNEHDHFGAARRLGLPSREEQALQRLQEAREYLSRAHHGPGNDDINIPGPLYWPCAIGAAKEAIRQAMDLLNRSTP